MLQADEIIIADGHENPVPDRRQLSARQSDRGHLHELLPDDGPAIRIGCHTLIMLAYKLMSGSVGRWLMRRAELVGPDCILGHTIKRAICGNAIDEFGVLDCDEHRDKPAIAPAEEVRALESEMAHERDNIFDVLHKAERAVDVSRVAVPLQVDLHDAPAFGELRKVGETREGKGAWYVDQRLALAGNLIIHIQAIDRSVAG